MDSCIVICPCCGTILQVTSNVLGSNAYPFHSNMQMSLRDMVNNQFAQPNYAQMCCAISQKEEENKSV